MSSNSKLSTDPEEAQNVGTADTGQIWLSGRVLIFETVREKLFQPQRKIAQLITCTQMVMESLSLSEEEFMVLLGMMSVAIPMVPWAL